MRNTVAIKYVKALHSSLKSQEFESAALLFDELGKSYLRKESKEIFDNPYIEAQEKEKILLSAVKKFNNSRVDNLLKLLVSNKRIDLLPSIAEEMRLMLAKSKAIYRGYIYSSSKIDSKVSDSIAKSLGDRAGVKIELEFVKTADDSVKVSVDDLGLQIDLSKSRLDAQLTEHILKAI